MRQRLAVSTIRPVHLPICPAIGRPSDTTKSCVRSLELAAAAPVFVVLAVVVLAAQVTELGLPVTAQAASALRIGQQRRSCAEYIPPCTSYVYDLSIL